MTYCVRTLCHGTLSLLDRRCLDCRDPPASDQPPVQREKIGGFRVCLRERRITAARLVSDVIMQVAVGVDGKKETKIRTYA